jgi:hypothetical protein
LKIRRYDYLCTHNYADMVKLVDMPDLGSGAARRVGSSPIIRTFKTQILLNKGLAFFAFNTCPTIAQRNEKRLKKVKYLDNFQKIGEYSKM